MGHRPLQMYVQNRSRRTPESGSVLINPFLRPRQRTIHNTNPYLFNAYQTNPSAGDAALAERSGSVLKLA